MFMYSQPCNNATGCNVIVTGKPLLIISLNAVDVTQPQVHKSCPSCDNFKIILLLNSFSTYTEPSEIEFNRQLTCANCLMHVLILYMLAFLLPVAIFPAALQCKKIRSV